VRSGEADVVVGPRSALFAPLPEPSLIILDEEHDGSYKQGSTPRYHARNTAQALAGITHGCVVLGSATPSVETYHAALTGRYRMYELPERVRQRPLPAVEIVDLRAEGKTRPGSVFGARLEESIRQRLAAGEQVILFLNRRGFSAFVLCRDCGHVPHCPNCDVSLTLHRQRSGVLLCHHCDYSRQAPTACSRCLGPRVKQFGLGTQRVEDTVKQLFPSARVARLDRDTTSAKDAHTRIIGQVASGEIDVLVGTQMVTKGFDFPGVTLVGVVTADVALNMPDFRASERAFQLLTQVSGRAGRGDRPGEVIVQTFNPEHPSIQSASRHDYRGFYTSEIASREELGYPPFGTLVRWLVSHPDETATRDRIEAAASILNPIAERLGVEVRGPAPCPLSRLKDRFRWHLLLKSSSRDALMAVLDEAWPQVQRRVGGVSIDVEPVDLL
jgi:primosomal protein N' (replication factor Y)